MLLFLNPTDIYSLEVGLISENRLDKYSGHKLGPEQYLSLLVNQMKEWNQDFISLRGVVVVEGPGSATSLRAGITIANTIGFVQNVPVIGIQKKDGVEALELIEQNNKAIRKMLNTKFIPLSPVYERAAV